MTISIVAVDTTKPVSLSFPTIRFAFLTVTLPLNDRPLGLPVQIVQLVPVKRLELLVHGSRGHALVSQHAALPPVRGGAVVGAGGVAQLGAGVVEVGEEARGDASGRNV